MGRAARRLCICFRARQLKLLEGLLVTIAIEDTTSAYTGTPDSRCCSVCTQAPLPLQESSAGPAQLDEPPDSRSSEELRANMRRAIGKCRRNLWESERDGSSMSVYGSVREQAGGAAKLHAGCDPHREIHRAYDARNDRVRSSLNARLADGKRFIGRMEP